MAADDVDIGAGKETQAGGMQSVTETTDNVTPVSQVEIFFLPVFPFGSKHPCLLCWLTSEAVLPDWD